MKGVVTLIATVHAEDVRILAEQNYGRGRRTDGRIVVQFTSALAAA
jgi:hypothetical protein